MTSTAKNRRFLSAGKKFARAATDSTRVLERHWRYLASSTVRRTSASCSSSAFAGGREGRGLRKSEKKKRKKKRVTSTHHYEIAVWYILTIRGKKGRISNPLPILSVAVGRSGAGQREAQKVLGKFAHRCANVQRASINSPFRVRVCASWSSCHHARRKQHRFRHRSRLWRPHTLHLHPPLLVSEAVLSSWGLVVVGALLTRDSSRRHWEYIRQGTSQCNLWHKYARQQTNSGTSPINMHTAVPYSRSTGTSYKDVTST